MREIAHQIGTTMLIAEKASKLKVLNFKTATRLVKLNALKAQFAQR
jgi:hypothetical protein